MSAKTMREATTEGHSARVTTCGALLTASALLAAAYGATALLSLRATEIGSTAATRSPLSPRFQRGSATACTPRNSAASNVSDRPRRC
jgi:hypothetical protein